jgi:hypothetical protein
MDYNELILENNRRRQVIRTIVKDIITVFKNEEEGEFYLPNYLEKNEDFYNFTNFQNNIILELVMTQNYDIDDFIVDGNYWGSDDVIEIIVDYNPDVKSKMLYDLVGELNQVVAHEIRHIDQNTKETFDLDGPEEEDPYAYYTQPHEIDAQVFGFKRLSKISNKPYEKVVRSWFDKHKDIHMLNDEEMNDVINILLKHRL